MQGGSVSVYAGWGVEWFGARSRSQAKKSQARLAAAGAILPMVKKSLRDGMLKMPLERISVEPHIHLSRHTLKKPSSECDIDRRAR